MSARPVGRTVLFLLLAAFPARADFTCGDAAERIYWYSVPGSSPATNNCLGGSGFRCYQPKGGTSTVELVNPACNPQVQPCSVRLRVALEFPGASQTWQEDGFPTGQVYWFAGPTSPSCNGSSATCGQIGICSVPGQSIIYDFMDTYILKHNVTCSDAASSQEVFSLTAWECTTPSIASCRKELKVEGLVLGGPGLAAAIGCPVPPPPPCTEPAGQASGASGTSCPLCQQVGGGCGVPIAGGGPSCALPQLGKAQVRYAAGGVGADGLPGSTAWRAALGRFWSHDWAERIVIDPDLGHVWLLTRYGSFREFSNLAAGGGLRLYQNRAPSDEFRKLYHDTATGGWELHSLDGRKDIFRSDGLWVQTVFAADPGHPVQGTYTGSQLVSVSFPDGRSDSFTYHPSGKLASITEVPVAGSGTPSRTWSFSWSGDELALATRPDGTAWQFIYDPARPGYLTRVDLLAGPQGRVEAAFEYQAGTNNVGKSWRGDPSFTGPNAVEKVTYSYTNPLLPTQTEVTRTVSASFDQVTTYSLARDSVSRKPKILSMQGSCPTCGLSPNTTFAYGGSNPLLPSSMTDAKGTRTDYTYSAEGRPLTKTEAANVPSLTRSTSYTYDSNFPGLITRVEVPSTSGGGNKRRTDSAYGAATGLLMTRVIDGFEGGAALPAGFKTTSYSYNASGEVLTIDPPGFGTTDATSFTYNLAGRQGHVADSRTDPLLGTTTFGYDGLNRRTSVIDPNGVETVISYDALNRVLEVRQKGAAPADDLATAYSYNVFGDLFCTKLPRGNGVENIYDAAGRLVEIHRGTAVATPTNTSCLDAALPRERTVYQYDNAGHHIEEGLERWDGTAWVSESKTAYEFTCHLDKVTQGAGSPTPSVTEYCYDLNDNLEKIWDASHPRSSNPDPGQLYTYDALNRVASVTVGPGGANAATTSYIYDVQDHLASVTDAEGTATVYITSDRDLLTQQISPASGTTVFTYNEHGELASTMDARGMVATRTLDAADRVTQETFGPSGSPDPALTIDYTYGSTPAQFDVGRLTGITRDSQTNAYAYDRFGRIAQDGSLAYSYDKNGNRTTITYPGSVVATYTHDFTDREATLSYDSGGGPQPLVTGAGYKAFGPLAALSLANGVNETRLFDQRYFPDRIQAGALLDWDYAVDSVGNPTAITGSILGTSYSAGFGYQEHLYFLTQGDGPWGSRAWTYDRIGNRLTSTRTSEPTQTYSYFGAGHSPRLSTIAPAPGWGTGAWSYSYDDAGNQTTLLESNDEGAVQTTFYDIAADGRMSALRTDTGPSRTDLLYDGRGYLREAHLTVTGSSDDLRVTPVYTSDGVLMARTEVRHWTGSAPGPDGEDELVLQMSQETTRIFYFAGRPVAQLTTGPELLYLTTDHLGTPVLATDGTGAAVWAGSLEPFGRTWTAGPDNPDPELATIGGLRQATASALGRLSSEKVFLRYPGQWASDVFRVTGRQEEIYYNVHRWYASSSGTFASPDPLGSANSTTVYGYALAQPLLYIDPLGLEAVPREVPRPHPEPPVVPRTYPRPVPPQPCPIPRTPPKPNIFFRIITAPVAIFLGLFFAASPADAPTLEIPTSDCCDDGSRESHCEKQLGKDMEKCKQWFPRGHSKRYDQLWHACKGQAMVRYGECMQHGFPLSPLSPHRFQY